MRSLAIGIVGVVVLFTAPVALLVLALVWLLQPKQSWQIRYVQLIADDFDNESAIDAGVRSGKVVRLSRDG